MFRSTFLYYDFLWLTAYKDLFLLFHFLAIISTIKERFFSQISIVTFLKNMEVDFKYNLSELRSNNNLWTYWGFKSCTLALISIDINWLFLKNALLGFFFRNVIKGIFLILRKGSISNDKMIDLQGRWISRKNHIWKLKFFVIFNQTYF